MLNISFNLSHIKYSVFSSFSKMLKAGLVVVNFMFCHISASCLSFNILNINNERTTVRK